MIDHVVLGARARWLSAEDQLFPALVSDPEGYQRVLPQIRAVATALRARCHSMDDLLHAEEDAAAIVADACPDGVALNPDLLMRLACAMRSRELAVAGSPTNPGRSAPGTGGPA